MAGASIGITATLLGVRLGLLELKAGVLRKDAEWLRIRASESQSYWTAATFRAVRACAEMPVDYQIKDDDATRLMEGPALIISNHQGALDIPAIAWFMRIWGQKDTRWVIKRKIRNLPFIGRSCEIAGCAFISRDSNNRHRDLKAVKESAKAAYDEGANFVLFTEGTRFKEPVPDSGYKHVLPPNPLMVSQLLKVMPNCQVCSLTLYQHPRGAPSNQQTLHIQAHVVMAEEIKDVRKWLKTEWDAKEAFIASFQHNSEAPQS
jgi:1-acyl-sn-glycerol-3-phosphate acyltransferase